MWVVRVVIPTAPYDHRWPIDPGFVDCLARANVIDDHGTDDERQCFDIRPPKGIAAFANREWADGLSGRLQSMGYNAVTAPEWLDREKRP